jgi:hypothetical protein
MQLHLWYWYSQSGTPEVSISTQYDTIKNTYTVTVTQQSKHFFPLSFALLDDAGNELEKGVLTIKDNAQSLIMNSIASKNATSSIVSASIIKDNHSFWALSHLTKLSLSCLSRNILCSKLKSHSSLIGAQCPKAMVIFDNGCRYHR